ncbi:MAG: hypothetical protein H6744_04120 [Deltaproteobacteria bacterium]|nr:hypothetical protein [Deltaproteobacteria bacterium]MCB9785864.1 hypothetical protein [Deltaproteobacteria bacterium]
MRQTLPCFILATLLLGCAHPQIVPLIGEDPEIYELLGKSPDDDPRLSPLGAARRLHQALIQQDAEVAWTLLAETTQRALDERAAAIGVSGRELLDASTLPGSGGTVHKVRYEVIFFGPDLSDLRLAAPLAADADEAVVEAVASTGQVLPRTFIRTRDGWKLHLLEF